MMYAARYSVPEDFDRGFSFVGGIPPFDTLEEAEEAAEEWRAKGLEFHDVFAVHVDHFIDPWGCFGEIKDAWMLAKPGLCAFVGDSWDEAVRYALEARDDYACGRELYCFSCRVVSPIESVDEGMDMNASRVVPDETPWLVHARSLSGQNQSTRRC